MASKKIVLTTMPSEGEFVNWTTPKFFDPTRENKYMPLGILSLATNIPQKHQVVLLDPPSEGWTIEETINRIENEKPDILGLSVVTRRVYAMNEILKATSAPYKVVGGPHATYYAEQILSSGAEAVFVGPLADLEFAQAIETLPKGIIKCQTVINCIKFPNRLLLGVTKYFPQNAVLFKAKKRLPMFSSIGCPNHCSFCNVQSKKIQLKNPESIVNEMEHLIDTGSQSIHILDDNFNVFAKHVKGIIQEIKNKNLIIEWSGRGQVKMDLSLATELAEVGFKRIHVGFEALDDNILRYFNKKLTLKDIRAFCKVMKKNKIDVLGYFILGSPLETREYRENFLEKIEELEITYPFFNMLFPEPNTKYYFELLKEGFYKIDHWAEYMKNPTPYFEIPYPYGKEKQNELIAYIEEITPRLEKCS